MVGHPVVRGEADVSIVLLWKESRHIPAVELLEVSVGGLPVSDMVEDVDERVVLLTINLFQLNGEVVGLRQCFRPEEIGSVVKRREYLFILRCHHGGELLQVANHEQLDASEGFEMVAEAPQHMVDGVEQVAAHHGNLVDDEQVERCDDASLLLAEVKPVFDVGIGNKRCEWQLEERVDGDPSCIDGRHPCWRHDNGSLSGAFHNGLEEGCLSCSGLSRKEDALPGVFHQFPCDAQLAVSFHDDRLNGIIEGP